MAGLVWIPWYVTVFRHEMMAAEISAVAPLVLRYGATQYSVQQSQDDRYKITQMAWFESKRDWYRYWDGPEMIEFRRRHSGHYQVPLVYGWVDELVSGALGPEVPLAPEPDPEPTAPVDAHA